MKIGLWTFYKILKGQTNSHFIYFRLPYL